MIVWTLLGIFGLFVIFALTRKGIQERFGFKICAICAAVSLTWVTLLALRMAGMAVSTVLLGILMGQSVVGIMYAFEERAKKAGKRNLLWLNVVVILTGTLATYWFLTRGADLGLAVILAISLLIAVIIYGSLKSGKKAIAHRNYGKFRKEIEKLEERFEHCCD